MADTVRIHLEGGPCAGHNATVTRTGDLLPGFTCKGADYQPTERVTADNRVVYTTKASQQKDSGSGGSGDLKRSHGPGSWHQMLRRVFVDAPNELQRSAKAREAMRGLRHRRGLR